MRPCAPPQLGGKQIPYPWFQDLGNNPGICLNAKGCGYDKNSLIWKKIKLTLTIGKEVNDGTALLNELYLTNNKKSASTTKVLTKKKFTKGITESIEFMIGLSSAYINGIYIKMGNEDIVIDKIVLEIYNKGNWEIILNSSLSEKFIKNEIHYYPFQTITIS